MKCPHCNEKLELHFEDNAEEFLKEVEVKLDTLKADLEKQGWVVSFLFNTRFFQDWSMLYRASDDEAGSMEETTGEGYDLLQKEFERRKLHPYEIIAAYAMVYGVQPLVTEGKYQTTDS